MGKYIARRLVLMVPTLFILTILVFLVLRVLPGDAAELILSGEEGALNYNTFTLESLRKELGLDRPLHIQYLTWIWELARFDLGNSLINGRSVREEILQRLPVTLQIALAGQILGLFIGVPLGVYSAVKQNTFGDLAVRFVSIIFLAIPSFWLGLMVVLFLALQFNYMPPIGLYQIWEEPGTALVQLIAPTLVIGHFGFALIARMTRSTMLEVMREDYIRTARAKGLREKVVIYRHALKNALIPVVTLSGLSFAGSMGGTVILEQIFSIPGMGQLFIIAIRERDYTIVQGSIVVFALIFMFVNLVVDILYGWLDPRISYS